MSDVARRAALAEADLLIDLGRTADALEVLTVVLAQDPGDVAALGLAALCHLDEDGDAVEALTLARRAADLAPTSGHPRRLAALAYLRLNQVGRAREAAAHAVRLDPDSWASHVVFSTAHLGDVRTRRCARDAARRAVDLAPQRWETHRLLARTYLDGGREPAGPEVEEAIVALDVALRLNPTSAELRHEVARAHLMRGWVARAVAGFTAALWWDPRRHESAHAIAACLAIIVRRALIAATLAVFAVWAAVPAAVDWAALFAFTLLVGVAVAGARVAAALRPSGRRVPGGVLRGERLLVVTAGLVAVSPPILTAAVLAPPAAARCLAATAGACLACAWLLQAARRPRRR